MNKDYLTILLIFIAMLVAVGAISQSKVRSSMKDDVKLMSDKTLWESLEKAKSDRLPKTAKPIIEELRRRIVTNKDTHDYLRLVLEEDTIRNRCYGEYDECKSNDELREKRIKEARSLWTPVKEVLLASLYDCEKNDVSFEEIVLEHEDELTQIPASEDFCPSNMSINGATLWDACIWKIVSDISYHNKDKAVDVWKTHLSKSDNDVSKNLFSLYELTRGISKDRKTILDTMHSIAKSKEAKALADYAESMFLLEEAVNLGSSDKSEKELCDEKCQRVISLLDGMKDVLVSEEFAQRVTSIKRQIEKPHLSVSSLPKVDIRRGIIPLGLSYANVHDVDVVLYESSPEFNDYRKVNYTRQKLKSKELYSWSLNLPQMKGRIHKSVMYDELKVEKNLKTGKYMIFVFPKDEVSLFAATEIVFSQLSASSISTDVEEWVYVTDVESGKPLKNVDVAGKRTNQDGLVSISPSNKNSTITLSTEDEHLQWSYGRYAYGERKLERRYYINVVTDRKIYRPGQVVYFKAWYHSSKESDRVPAPTGEELSPRLRLANGETIEAPCLMTNEFGTIHGSFKLPDDAYCGGATIEIVENKKSMARGYAHIQIDEYKRTGLTISYDEIRNVIIPGDTARITGNARQANGNPVADALVKYTLRSECANSDNETLETRTDDNGDFTIEFATRESKYDSQYCVDIVLTDQKGESVESSRVVMVTQEGTIFSMNTTNEQIVRGDDIEAHLSLKNANEGLWAGEVKWSLLRMERCSKTPDEERPLFHVGAEVDTILISNPYYNVNGTFNKEDEGTEVLSGVLNVEGDVKHTIETADLMPGRYKLKATCKMANGKERCHESVVSLLSEVDGSQLGLPSLWSFAPNQATLNSSINLRVGSGLNGAYATLLMAVDNHVSFMSSFDISMEIKTLKVSMPDDMPRSGSVTLLLLVHGSEMTLMDRYTIQLKKPEIRIPITLSTFRDVTSPSSHEKWTLTVGNDSVHAPQMEVLVSMYDERLDKLVGPNLWNFYFNENRYYASARVDLLMPSRDGYNRYGRPVSAGVILYPDKSFGNILPKINNYWSSGCSAELELGAPMLFSESAKAMGGDFVVGFASAARKMNDVSYDAVEEEVLPVDNENGTLQVGVDDESLRQNFAETAFFFPDLRTDEANGQVTFEFDVPDNLTTYVFQAVACSQDMQKSSLTASLAVRKALAVTMGAPRFAVEGDEIILTALVEAYESDVQSALCTMSVSDKDGNVIAQFETKNVDFLKSRSEKISWRLKVPEMADALILKTSVRSGSCVDGEQVEMKVEKRCVETHEALPFVVVGKEYHNDFAEDSERIERQKMYGMGNLVFRYNSNAFMEVVEALPQLDDEWGESSDTYLGRIETAAIASLMKSRSDVMKAVDAILDGKYKMNESFVDDSSATPWMKRAKHMEKHRKQVDLLLSGSYSDRMMHESLAKLRKLQNSDGSVSWFKKMEGSEWMTVAVADMLGRMVQMGLLNPAQEDVSALCAGATRFMDKCIMKECQEIRKRVKEDEKYEPYIGAFMLDELYARALMPSKLSVDAKYLIDIVRKSAQRSMDESYRIQAANLMVQVGAKKEAEMIVRSLVENLQHPRTGLASVYVRRFFYPTFAEITSQSRLVILLGRMEAMGWTEEVDNMLSVRNELLSWLIFQKRTTAWPDKQSTAIAVLAVMGANADMVSVDEVRVGTDTYTLTVGAPQVEKCYDAISTVSVVKSKEFPSWGSWQWTELTARDELKSTGCDELKVKRVVYVKRGSKYMPLETTESLSVGDVVKIELTLLSDVDLDFVHLRDYKAASFEPTDQISGYSSPLWWFRKSMSDVPHYYQPHDASVDFFIEHLRKGSHNLSYESTVTNAGVMAGGYAEVQCLYAPEIVAKSAGSLLIIR